MQAPITIQLFDGAIGQEIFFVYSDATTNTVTIQAGSNTSLVLDGGTVVELSGQGQTAHFMCIDDGTGNGDWYLVGGAGYTIA